MKYVPGSATNVAVVVIVDISSFVKCNRNCSADRRLITVLEKKNYTDLKKAAKYRSVWRTVRRDCHKPA